MKNILDNITSLLAAVVYYVKAAVSVLVSNKYLMAGSLLLLLTAGKSFNIGKLISYKSK